MNSGGLLGAKPRNVRLSEKGRHLARVALFFIVPGLLGALWLVVDIPRHYLRREALRRDGVETMGKIERFGKFGRSSEWWVKYVFEVRGRSIRNEVTVPRSFRDSLSGADSLSIRYVPSDPGNNHPAAWEWTVLSEMEWLVPLAWMIPGLMMANILRQERNFATEGAAALGTITSCSPAKNAFRIAYDFRGPDGNIKKGSGWSPCMKEAGAPIDVLFLPREPSRSLPYPLEDYRIEDESS